MFDKDIRGDSWQPCAACPRSEPGVCPSRRHRPWCDIAGAGDPATVAVLLSLPDEAEAPVERSCVPDAPDPQGRSRPMPPGLCFEEPAIPEGPPASPPAAPDDESEAMKAYNAKKLLVFACDYRGPQAMCGCTSTHVCFKGKGRPMDDGLVGDATLWECFDCISTPEA